MTTQNPEIAAQLLDRLADTAERLRRDRLVTDYEIACAFLSVGMTVARAAHGPAQTAEWLRDIADEIEHGIAELHQRPN